MRRKRGFSTNLQGIEFSEKDKEKVWGKGEIIRGKNPDLYRRDVTGKELYWPSYGKDSSKGWQIDHKKPISKGGTDNIFCSGHKFVFIFVLDL